MKSATLTVNTPFLFAPTDRATRPAARRQRTVRQPAAPATGLFARLERETAVSRPETVVFALLALTGVAWPAYEALRAIAGF